MDLTQRDTEALRSQRYRALFESIDDGYCLMQLLFDEHDHPVDYRFLETNATFEEHTGLKNAKGRTARELVPDLDASWFELYGKVALTGEAARFENQAPAMGGRWFEVYASRVGDPALRQVALVFKNITARKAAQDELQESEARFRNMADHAPVMLWVTESDGRCIYLNRYWYDFTGQTEQTGLGFGWLDAVHPDDAPKAAETFITANAARVSFRLDYRLRRADGQYCWAIDAASPRFGSGGEFLGYIGSVIDISDRKRMEEERESLLMREREARAQAEHANRIKDEFIATISHELRTPLSAVFGWIHILRTRNLTREKYERALETIDRNARSLARLVEDLLDIGRILSGKVKLEMEPVVIERVVEQALESVRPAAEAKSIHIEAELGSANVLTGDAARLQQVVWNLLVNAVKFTGHGGVVRVHVTRHDDRLELVVADTGQGISKSFLPHVFERFRQEQGGTTRRSGGLGLGLSIVKHVTEAHGGKVTAASEGEGKGATFSLDLPVSFNSPRVFELLAKPPKEPHVAVHDCPPNLENLHVCVVDDEADTRDMLRTLLEGCNARVTTAASAKDAYVILRSTSLDLLISDIGMPDEDGYSFIRNVRRSSLVNQGLPAVALTAYARTEDRRDALDAGFHAHVSKPVTPQELLAVLATLTHEANRSQPSSGPPHTHQ